MLAACWALSRRKFYEIHKANGSPIASRPCVVSPNSMPSKAAFRA